MIIHYPSPDIDLTHGLGPWLVKVHIIVEEANGEATFELFEDPRVVLLVLSLAYKFSELGYIS